MVESLHKIKRLLGENRLPQRGSVVDHFFNLSGSACVSKRKVPTQSDKGEISESSLLQLEQRLTKRGGEGVEERAVKKRKGPPKEKLPRAAKGASAGGEGVCGVHGGSGAKRARRS
jgi:hypothetical protein